MQRILIIEDDLIDQMAITRLFDRQGIGIQCTIANSISEAKNNLTNDQFDLVISDLNLADGTTFDLLDIIKDTPIIIITGNQDEATIESLKKNSGAFAYLIKDIDLKYLDELSAFVRQIFSNNYSADTFTGTDSGSNRTNQVIRSENVVIDLRKIYKTFDNRKEDVKETIEIFIQSKTREMDDLNHYINNRDCGNVAKLTHRMKSGFRVLGMEAQEKLTDYIEKKSSSPEKGCLCETVTEAFQQLSLDTKLAIDLLKKEVPLL